MQQNGLKNQLTQLINNKTKPLGALGMLEDIALQIGLIQQSTQPAINNPHIIVFAGDHGIAATGLVNPYPQAVTAQMVLNFLNEGAAINVFCRQNDIQLKVVDAGVNCTWDEDKNHSQKFFNYKIGYGTHNYLGEKAMTEEEALLAISKGREAVNLVYQEGCNCIGFGEMGIGNTSSATLIMSAITGMTVEETTGRGTGANDEQLQTKIETLNKVHSYHQLQQLQNEPIRLVSAVGGFEIAMMAGAYLQAAANNMIILVDGFIATAALLIAVQIQPEVKQFCIFAHTSGEQAHEKMLGYLQVKPLLNLGLRLGEGTGAALAVPLIKNAVAFVNEMASFDSANVSKSPAGCVPAG